MRGSNRLLLGKVLQNQKVKKSSLNFTKGIDSLAEDFILASLEKKLLTKKMGVKAFTVFVEELGIVTLPKGANKDDSELVILLASVNSTEFIKSL
jgi:hypothetical protein